MDKETKELETDVAALELALFQDRLVSFGNYLLSKERKESLVHKVNKDCVTHADIENWIAKQN